MSRVTAWAGATALILTCMMPALAQLPVAVVEEVHGSPTGVEFMDYVAAGQVFELKPSESIVLGYLKSCWHETIKGGTVVVGSEQSEVQGGKLTRVKVPCDGGKIALTAGQASQSAGTSFRALDQEPQAVYGLSPVVQGPGGGALQIMRIDRAGEYYVAKMPVMRGKQLSIVDFATTKKRLTAGGTYRATLGAQQIEFKVALGAKPRGVAIISRLLRFPMGQSAK